MDNNNQANGNTQLNQLRNDFNGRVLRKKTLGSSMRVQLNNKRRYRTI
jgi:hypothetical protein|tara:strand:- start:269 stop:412 length:144 start_codon:yes stop_codon:yes gene_type:complete